jgi:hypothetical protein
MVAGVCPTLYCEKSSTSSRAETPEWDSAEFRQTDQINGLRSLFGDVIRTRSVIKGLPVFIIVDPLRDLLPIKWQQIRLIWRPPMTRWLLAIAVVLAGVGTVTPARADADSERVAITDRLQRWTVAFNARDAAGVCDVFAPDLVSTVPDALDSRRDALCGKLSAVLAKPGL